MNARTLDLGRQGFGAMRLTDATTGMVDRDPTAVVHAALDAGVRMIDTADAYQNEDVIGRAIRGRRDDVLLASKFGLVWQGAVAGDFDVRADAAYVQQACDASLRRLGVDVIDLYYLHHRSESTPIDETVGAMAELIDQGKVRAIGLSNVTAADLRRASAVHSIAALQEHWSLDERTIEDELLSVAVETATPVVAHSPTSHGLLRSTSPDVPAEVRHRRAALDGIARARGVTAGQVALAWVHHRERVHDLPVVPLPGTTRVSHLLDNVRAMDLELSDDDLSSLER